MSQKYVYVLEESINAYDQEGWYHRFIWLSKPSDVEVAEALSELGFHPDNFMQAVAKVQEILSGKEISTSSNTDYRLSKLPIGKYVNKSVNWEVEHG